VVWVCTNYMLRQTEVAVYGFQM